MILDNELELSLRPMRYPQFFYLYKDSCKNIWGVDELDFSQDYEHLRDKLTPAECHLIQRLVAFFATADNLVAHNLVLNLYKNVNSPEYRMFLGKQLFDEMLHVETYLLLVDNYIKDPQERIAAFDAYKNIPSIKTKADFCFKYMQETTTKQQFLENIICYASCVEGLFFFGSFAYVYFLRSKGLLPALATATDWVFRDESMHMEAAMQVVDAIRVEYPELFTPDLQSRIISMMQEALNAEMAFCQDALSEGVTGLQAKDMMQYLQYTADARLVRLGYKKQYNVINPFGFMVLQDTRGLTNFFDKRVTEYQKGITGEVVFDEEF